MPRFKYLDTLVLIFVVVLLVSNLVAQKVCRLGPLTISGAELLFPITYIFADVFTEVYGYQASRRAIWIGLFASALLTGGVLALSSVVAGAASANGQAHRNGQQSERVKDCKAANPKSDKAGRMAFAACVSGHAKTAAPGS